MKINHNNFIKELKFFEVFYKVKDFLQVRRLKMMLVKRLTIFVKVRIKFHQIRYFLFH